MTAPFDWATAFEAERNHLFGVAYRMVGSGALADDLVQDTWLRARASGETPRSARAYLTTIVTRLALDALTSARARREAYVGPWLPEPILTRDRDAMTDAEAQLEQSQEVSLALLSVLESLSPLERAAFLLREAFDYDYAEIATVLGRTEPTCRQLHRRARARVGATAPRFSPAPEEVERLLSSFLIATSTGDASALEALLAADVTATSDGGGRVRAALNVVRGRDHVTRFLIGLAKKAPADLRVRRVRLNGAPAVLFFDGDRLFQAAWIETAEGRITAFSGVLNPDKLDRLASALAPTRAEL